MKYQQEGARLRQARESAKVTLDDAGRHVGRSGPAVRHWETGRSKPDVDVARALDELYGTGGEIAALYGYSAEPGALTLADLDEKLQVLIDGQGTVATLVSTAIADATEAVETAIRSLAGEVESLRRSQQRSVRDARPRR